MNNTTIAIIMLLLALIFSIWFILGARKHSRNLKYNKETEFKRMERLSR